MNHISPCNHPESSLSGSTIESMIDRTVELGLNHFAITDIGSMSSIIRGYKYAKKKNVKIVPGLEIVFRDSACNIIADNESGKIKYFKLLVHAQDQEALQRLTLMVSDQKKKQIIIGNESFGAFEWSDLEEISKYNVTVSNSDSQDMITKHIAVDRLDNALAYYRKIKNIFGDKFYPSITPYSFDKYWQSIVEVTLSSGNVVHIPAHDRIETDSYKAAKAADLPRRGNRHKLLKSVFINKVKYTVAEEHQQIVKASLINKFEELPGGDLQTKCNNFIISVSKREGDFDRLLINNNSFYSNEGDQIVQSMKLGEENRIHHNQHMRSIDECADYLKGLGFSEADIVKLVQNSHRWAAKFDDFNLKYEYKLADCEGDPKELLMKTIEEVGRMDWNNPIYVKQFEEELDLLTNNGKLNLIPYFLPIVDIYKSYKDNGFLTGPGRGSAGGFLISYLIGITHVDPIKYELSTSRFLTLDRVEQGNLPDIDFDVEDRSHLVGKDGNGGYLFNKYGNKAAQISTRTLLRIKSAILDANRFVNKGRLESEIQALSKSLPTTPQGVNDMDYVFGYDKDDGTHEKGLIEINDDLLNYASSRPKEWDIVKRALSLSRQKSRHSCAYIISNRPIEDTVPIIEVGGVKRVTAPEAKYCEEAGLIKYDFLVVDAVKTTRVALDYINKKHGNIDMETGYFMENGKKTFVWDLPEDPEVFKMLHKGHTETLFQLKSATATPLVMDIKPESISDCAVITSLGRPGPLDFRNESGRNMAEEYAYRKRGISKSHLQVMHDMLPETHGILCVAEDSRVKTSNGLVKIQDIKEGMLVQTENGQYKEVVANIDKGRAETIKIRTDNAEELIVTKDHKVLTNRGWIEAGELTNRDLIKSYWVSDEDIEEGDDKDWVVGMLLADGSLKASTYAISCGSRDNANKIKSIIDATFDLDCTIYHHCRCWYVSTRNKKYNNKVANEQRRNPLKSYCKKIGIDGLTCYNKKFPKKITKKMLEGFIEGDGCVYNKRIRLCNKIMARQIFTTLQALRIKSGFFQDNDGAWTVSFEQTTLNYKIKEKPQTTGERGLYIPRKKPEIRINRDDNRNQHFNPKAIKQKPFISMKKYNEMAEDYGFNKNFDTWSKVLQITPHKEVQVYDLSVDEIHSFVVGGLVVHNCYQEQVSKLAKDLAGMSVIDAENVRIAVGKKKVKLIESLKPIFIEGASKKIGESQATEVWDMMETFARYGFNKSHAVAYSVITYAGAYFKYHYPLEWWAAVVSTSTSKKINEEYYKYIKDLLLPPDINVSTEEISIDYDNRKLRSKLSMITGLGKKVANKIMDGRPYKDLKDFVKKKPCGPSLTRKLIHVGALDSFFGGEKTFLYKIQQYENTLKEVEFDNKILSYHDKIAEAEIAGDVKAVARIQKNMQRYVDKGPKEGIVPEKYVIITPKNNFLMKKDVFPTMTMDLNKVLLEDSNLMVIDSKPYPRVLDKYGRDTILVSGEHLQRIDEMELGSEQKVKVCCPAYVTDMEEFTYAQGSKKALKLNLDSSGYISERVLWADYETGELIYPDNLKKGSIIYVFYTRKQNTRGQCYTNISDIIVESSPI